MTEWFARKCVFCVFFVCVCVRVRVCVWERDRDRERERGRESLSRLLWMWKWAARGVWNHLLSFLFPSSLYPPSFHLSSLHPASLLLLFPLCQRPNTILSLSPHIFPPSLLIPHLLALLHSFFTSINVYFYSFLFLHTFYRSLLNSCYLQSSTLHLSSLTPCSPRSTAPLSYKCSKFNDRDVRWIC